MQRASLLVLLAACAPPPEASFAPAEPTPGDCTTACDAVESGAECGNGRDDDGDGYLDCRDFGCAAAPGCETAQENSDAECGNGGDDDADGYVDCVDFGCAYAEMCRRQSLRIGSWNIHDLDPVTSPEYAAARTMLARTRPDVLCLGEVRSYETSRLAQLADELGYAWVFQGRASTAMAAELTNVCLSKLRLLATASLRSRDISGDAEAEEIARDIVHVRVETPGGELDVFAVHFKSGFDDRDYFRRAIEARRLAEAVERNAGAAAVVLGDFNEEIDGGALGRVFYTMPAGMPQVYRLGADVELPVFYEPFATLGEVGLEAAEATHEDSPSNFATRIPSGRRIDYVFTRGLSVLGDEVYDVCADNGADDSPAGLWLEKYDAPPGCDLLGVASDHRLLLADVDL